MAGKILVLAATGTVGSEVVNALQAKESDFVVGARNEAKAREKFGPGVPVVPFDFENPGTYPAAFAGVERLFLTGVSFNPAATERIAPIVEYAGKQGVQHIVYSSVMGADASEDNTYRRIERAIERTGAAYTFLRPNFFHQNFTNYDRDRVLQGQIYFPSGEGKTSYIDVRDIGAVAAEALTTDGHFNRIYTLTGPEALSFYEIADQLGEALGRPVEYLDPSAEEYATALRNAGMPEIAVDLAVTLYGVYIKQGYLAAVTPDVAAVLGREPIRFRQYAREAFGQA